MMRNRTPVYCALAGVLAPAATIRLAGHAVLVGLVASEAALVVLVAGPVALGCALLAAGWLLGVHGNDPLDRFRQRPTVRERIPGDAQARLSEKTLEEPASEAVVPPGLFYYGLLYCLVVPVVSLAVML